MARKCEIMYEDNEVILGDITFLHEEIDGVNKAIINRIDTIIECNSPDEAEEVGEANLEIYDSYIVPSLYSFDIEVKLK
jgi:hypothetical protein